MGWGWWVGGLGEGGEWGVKVVEGEGVVCGLEGGLDLEGWGVV